MHNTRICICATIDLSIGAIGNSNKKRYAYLDLHLSNLCLLLLEPATYANLILTLRKCK